MPRFSLTCPTIRSFGRAGCAVAVPRPVIIRYGVPRTPVALKSRPVALKSRPVALYQSPLAPLSSFLMGGTGHFQKTMPYNPPKSSITKYVVCPATQTSGKPSQTSGKPSQTSGEPPQTSNSQAGHFPPPESLYFPRLCAFLVTKSLPGNFAFRMDYQLLRLGQLLV